MMKLKKEIDAKISNHVLRILKSCVTLQFGKVGLFRAFEGSEIIKLFVFKTVEIPFLPV